MWMTVWRKSRSSLLSVLVVALLPQALFATRLIRGNARRLNQHDWKPVGFADRSRVESAGGATAHYPSPGLDVGDALPASHGELTPHLGLKWSNARSSGAGRGGHAAVPWKGGLPKARGSVSSTRHLASSGGGTPEGDGYNSPGSMQLGVPSVVPAYSSQHLLPPIYATEPSPSPSAPSPPLLPSPDFSPPAPFPFPPTPSPLLPPSELYLPPVSPPQHTPIPPPSPPTPSVPLQPPPLPRPSTPSLPFVPMPPPPPTPPAPSSSPFSPTPSTPSSPPRPIWSDDFLSGHPSFPPLSNDWWSSGDGLLQPAAPDYPDPPPPSNPSLPPLYGLSDPSAAPAPAPADGPPSVWDSRDKLLTAGINIISAVRFQGSCSSCVAFTVMAAAETAYALANRLDAAALDFSEQHLFFCDGLQESLPPLPGCHDGWILPHALQVLETSGAYQERCYPYDVTRGSASCKRPFRGCTDGGAVKGSWSLSIAAMDEETGLPDLSSVKQLVMTLGSAMACHKLYGDMYWHPGGVYRWDRVSQDLGWHCAQLIGWDDAQRYWLFKSSWGTEVADKGFFKIAYGEAEVMTLAVYGLSWIPPETDPSGAS